MEFSYAPFMCGKVGIIGFETPSLLIIVIAAANRVVLGTISTPIVFYFWNNNIDDFINRKELITF